MEIVHHCEVEDDVKKVEFINLLFLYFRVSDRTAEMVREETRKKREMIRKIREQELENERV